MKIKSLCSLLLVGCLSGALLSCAGQPVSEDGEFAEEDGAGASSGAGGGSEAGLDENLNDNSGSSADGGGEIADSGDDLDSLDKDLEKEQKMAEGNDALSGEDPLVEESDKDKVAEAPAVEEPKKDELTSDPQIEPAPEAKVAETAEENPPTKAEETKDPLLDVPPEEVSPSIANPTSPEPTESAPSEPGPKMSQSGKTEITNIKFEGNEGGGSIVIEGNQPLEFTSRMNSQANQYVIEVNNAHLPDKLKRPYITKDFPSSVGSIDAYQTPGTDSVKVVVQLREGASEPSTHTEGSAIIIIPSGALPEDSKIATSQQSPDAFTGDGGGILSSKNLEQFLSGNMKYYGKKISVEIRDIEVRNAINLIAEESGANLVMSEGVTGNLALKLKNVPWDQALILILKAKKLGYTRQGNVLRISPMSEIKQEEEEAMKLVESRRKIEALKVQMIPINYAKISDLQGQIKTVITERGSIVADSRTNSLILTETEEVLERAKKIIASLDIAPAQVLIEGKLVEARESFNKRLGIQWDVAGSAISLGDGPAGPINMTPNLNVRPGTLSGGSLGFNLSLGTLDILGDLNAVLSLEEQEENVRVISSPRIVTLHNEDATITQEAMVPVVVSENKKDGQKTYKDLTLKMDLNVTPEVANNGVVQMKVNISRQFLGAIRTDGTAGSHTRTAKTKVMVKSGQTAVIGGIYQNDTSQLENGVPFLKDIPLIGVLFRDSNFHKDKTELLLFLTPRILSQAGTPVQSQDVSSSDTESNGQNTKVE